jgi:hypothetical protein
MKFLIKEVMKDLGGKMQDVNGFLRDLVRSFGLAAPKSVSTYHDPLFMGK